MSEYLEFTVCLKDAQDKDNFIQQMASDVQILNSVIPVRSCEVKEEEIPLKRYVKYKLTIEEADALEKDPRISQVYTTLPNAKRELLGFRSKSSTFKGLVEESVSIQSTNYTGDEFATISLPSSSGVDIVITDSWVAPNHQEFRESSDVDYGIAVDESAHIYKYPATSGDSRVFALTQAASILNDWESASLLSDHGTHVAGTAAGKTQGWCRNARIINIDFLNFGTGAFNDVDLLNWHNFKVSNEINRPTIVNNSWGYSAGGFDVTDIVSIEYRGDTYYPADFPTFPTFTSEDVTIFDKVRKVYQEYLSFFISKCLCFIYAVGADMLTPATCVLASFSQNHAYTDSVIDDHIDAGMIYITAAGNASWAIVEDTSPDWNNTITVLAWNGFSYINYPIKYNRGGTPNHRSRNIDNSQIIVGATRHKNYKADFSSCGTAITVYAPGEDIVSSVKDIDQDTTGDGVNDDTTCSDQGNACLFKEYGDQDYVALNGTSMASPQVCGVLGLVAQKQITDRVNLVTETISHSVTVDTAASPSSRYKIDGSHTNAIKFYDGNTYYLAMSESDMSAHPLRLSTIPDGRVDGTVDSSYDYTTGVTVTTTGLQFVVPVGAPNLYHYCQDHSYMGYGADNSTPNPITVSTHPTVGWPMNNANAQASGVAYLTSSSYSNLYDSNVAESGVVQNVGGAVETAELVFPGNTEISMSLRSSPNRYLFFDADVTRCGESLDKPPCLWGESGCDDDTSDSGAGSGSDSGSDSGVEGQGIAEYPTDLYKDDIEDIINKINEKTINSRSLKNDKWWWQK